MHYQSDLGITPPQRQQQLRLSDGRQLTWWEWGPTNGLAVVFCTGAAMSGWLGFGTHLLDALGIRLIAPDRPGLGFSDPHLHKSLPSWGHDMAQVLQTLGTEPVGAVGFSQGAPFALALAAQGLVQSVAVVAGQDELSHPAVLPLLHPNVAQMVRLAQQDPSGFEQHFAQSLTPQAFWQLVLNMSSPHDQGLYQQPVFAGAYQRALQEGLQQGGAGYARDLLNALSPWPFALETLEVPTHLWYGQQDQSWVHSPNFGATLAQRLPRAKWHLEASEGGSILWTRSEPILASLKADLLR